MPSILNETDADRSSITTNGPHGLTVTLGHNDLELGRQRVDLINGQRVEQHQRSRIGPVNQNDSVVSM
jgi:hypothetical protein